MGTVEDFVNRKDLAAIDRNMWPDFLYHAGPEGKPIDHIGDRAMMADRDKRRGGLDHVTQRAGTARPVHFHYAAICFADLSLSDHLTLAPIVALLSSGYALTLNWVHAARRGSGTAPNG
jgi:hypothetical protein